MQKKVDVKSMIQRRWERLEKRACLLQVMIRSLQSETPDGVDTLAYMVLCQESQSISDEQLFLEKIMNLV